MSNATLHPVRGVLRRTLVGVCAVGLVTLAAPAAASAYGWPVKPFHVQHPVRGFFGDPRSADCGRRQFHFGIDIYAKNGTAVYATLSGRVFLGEAETFSPHPDVVEIVGPGGLEFSYWHVIPAVRHGQLVTAYRTVIGHILKPNGHVHFSEAQQGVYVNPLRRG